MSNFNLKEFQVRTIENLTKSVSELLSIDAENKVCVFQSPTGSGKTIMVAKFIEVLIKELVAEDFCFLWVSIGKGDLHRQSKKSLEKVFEGFPRCALLEDEFFGSRRYISQNEVVVVNWEKIRSKDKGTGDWKNKLMREGEGINFIEVLKSTKEKRRIILIIDESHQASDTKLTQELRQIIDADITFEMSATPKIQPSAQDLSKGFAKYVYVDPKDVIEEGLIKKELIINEDIGSLMDDEKTSQDVIIEAAYNKRIELKEAYLKAGSDINPLCLIQLPNAEAGQAKKEVVESFLADKGITESNGRLAIWLSEEKSDGLDEISDFHSEVDFLLFKQAIDTGWDCPRAHILVKLRDIQSYTFEVQTVGRILRMPEQNHYTDETLNIGYIFTNLQSITVAKEEYNPNIIKHLKASRKRLYKPLLLTSYHKSRVDFGDITPSFQNVLEGEFCHEFDIEVNPTMVNHAENALLIKAKGMAINIDQFQDTLMTNTKLRGDKFDDIIGDIKNPEGSTVEIRLSDNDLLDTFNQVIKENLNGFSPKRSIPTVRQAIYLWFKKYLGINFTGGGIIMIQNLFLNQENKAKFSQLLSKSTSSYIPIKKEEVKKKIEETFYEWDVKIDEFYNQHSDEKLNHKLCIYEPCYLTKERSRPEKEFEKHLETKGNKIEWWIKNGTSKKDFFGIKYLENEMPHTFYPDYLIQLKSGKIFICDTKAGNTATDAKLKADALQAYIKAQNRGGKNLGGGILIQDSSSNWRINQQDIYNYDKNDLNDWKYFDDLI